MRANLRVGLMLGNHHPRTDDERALELILGALKATRERVPGEVIAARYTPEDTVWVFSLGGGVWELQQGPEGSWNAVQVPL